MSDMAIRKDTSQPTIAQRRLRVFAIHLASYFVVMIGVIIASFLLAPGQWWFAFPMVVWGAPLALHAAYAMGLFGSGSNSDE